MDGEEEMKNFLKSDYFLLTVAAIVSVFLWIYVSYEVNPTYERWIEDIKIEYTNESQEFETGKLIILSGNDSVADIKIRGRRGNISVFGQKDINCSVNLAGITEPGKYTLPVTFSTSVYGIEIVQKTPGRVEIVVDEVITTEHKIGVVTTGDIGEDYAVGEVAFSPQTVKITGPKTIVENIKSAKAAVDVNGVTTNIKGLYKIKFYDDKGNEIADGRISNNIEYCDVELPVYSRKKLNVVPVLSDKINSNGEKISFGTVEPESIYVIGDKDALKDINEIYTETIYTANITAPQTASAYINLSQLPEGVSVEGNVANIKVSFKVENNDNSQSENGGND